MRICIMYKLHYIITLVDIKLVCISYIIMEGTLLCKLIICQGY